MASKLTESTKREILAGFKAGMSLSALAKEHGCTPSTITRTVKSFIDDNEYNQLINQKKRVRAKKSIKTDTSVIAPLSVRATSKEKVEPSTLINDQNNKNIEDLNEHNVNINSPSNNIQDTQFFTELIPLNEENTWDKQKEVACIPLDSKALPEVVYMLVDKKVELESRPLKEFSEWSFLPDEDQERFAIPLFSNQRDAKRTCSRNQRVLKVPNSKVFLISSSYLLAKGITRLIIDDSLISIDN